MARGSARGIERWKIQDSTELYGLDKWGASYLSISGEGHLLLHPDKGEGPSLDLKTLMDSLLARGVLPPILLRVPQLLQHRLGEIHAAFHKAIEVEEYQNRYAGIYPIKVNQQSHVVHEYLEYAEPLGFGIEAGSKPELLAVMALVENRDMPIVCNGFKDDEFIESVILATKIGKMVIPIVEKFSELEMIVTYAEKHGVRPRIGVRAKLASRGIGRWESSAGIRSKFGLTIPEMIRALDYLRERDMADCLQLLHFHMGSQVSNIRQIKAAITEAARLFVELHKAGAGMQFLDVGGGLGVDYDGSRSTIESSINYTLDEYANDVVYRIKTVCDDAGVPHPMILSESGRAMIAYHSLLITNVLGSTSAESVELGEIPTPADEDAQPLHDLHDIETEFTPKNFLEHYHDAVQAREEAINLFNLGYLSLEERARAEALFWRVCRRVQKVARSLNHYPEELEGLDELMAETYFCNFSVFQSMPDSWAIQQLFPVMPIHRLDEEPTQRGILADITCDSDGKIDHFVHPTQVKRTLELHPLRGEPYYLGIFLLGAYQEILGDLHNLFGDTNAVHIYLDEDGEPDIKHLVEGDTVSEVLSYVQFEVKDLIARFRREVERAVRERRLSLEESAQLLRFYIDGLNGYTYLEEPQHPSVLAQAQMPASGRSETSGPG